MDHEHSLRRRPTRDVELTGHGCVCDDCLIKHLTRVGKSKPKKKKKKEQKEGPTKIAKRYDMMVVMATNIYLISSLG